MDAILQDQFAPNARDRGLSASQIIGRHREFFQSLATPTFGGRRLFRSPLWLIGEAPKKGGRRICPSLARLAKIWPRLLDDLPVDIFDLIGEPMAKSRSRRGDVRPRLMDAALGARKLLRNAVGLSGTAIGDLAILLLGATVRGAFGADRLRHYEWHRLPRSAKVHGELFVATIPHPSPLHQTFDERRVRHLLLELAHAHVRRPRPCSDRRAIDCFDLGALEVTRPITSTYTWQRFRLQ